MLYSFKILLKRILKKSNKVNIEFTNLFFRKVFGINQDFPIVVHYTTQIASPHKIKIEGGKKTIKSFKFSGNCYFSGYNGINIGYNVLFAPGVKVISSNHNYSNERNSIKVNPININRNVWIGTNAIILPGVTICENSVIGAGSVVNKDVPPNTVVGGVPAKILKKIDNIS